MKSSMSKKHAVIFAGLGLFTMLAFQNCMKSNVEFTSNLDDAKNALSNPDVVVQLPDDEQGTTCIDFDSSVYNEDCSRKEFGLKGSLYYLFDPGDGIKQSSYLVDKDNANIEFTARGISSVNVILDRGLKVPGSVLISNLDVPDTKFDQGFRVSESGYLADASGKKLFEAFALDLRSHLVLGGKEAGNYEIAILSDDGSLVDLDLDGSGVMKTVINNDNYHASRLGCSVTSISMGPNSKIPLRVRYFQGPRTQISLQLFMRKIASAADAGQDSACHVVTQQSGANVSRSSSGASSLRSRGWFVVPESMLLIK